MGQNSSLIATESNIKSFLKSEISAQELFSTPISSNVWMKFVSSAKDQKLNELADFAVTATAPNANICEFFAFYFPAYYAKGNQFTDRELDLFILLSNCLLKETDVRQRIVLIRALISLLAVDMYSLDQECKIPSIQEVNRLLVNLLQDVNSYLLSDSLIPFHYKIVPNLCYPLLKVSYQLASILLSKIPSVEFTSEEEMLYFYPLRQWNFHRKESVAGSFRNVRMYNEALSGILAFKPRIIKNLVDVLEAICSFLLIVQQDASYLPTVKMSSIILRVLSDDPDFCVKCNQTIDLSTLGYPFSSNLFPQTNISWADLLFTSILSFLSSQTTQFLEENLLFCRNFCVFVENTCPFTKVLSNGIYSKLLQIILRLMEKFKVTSLALVAPLVKSAKNLLEYNYKDHSHLVLAICKLKTEFIALKVEIGKFTKGKNIMVEGVDEESVLAVSLIIVNPKIRDNLKDIDLELFYHLIDTLTPKMEELSLTQDEKGRIAKLDFIKSEDSMVEQKSVYKAESYELPQVLRIWKKSFLWSSIYNSCYIDDPDYLRECLPVWTGTNIKLFKISTGENSVINSV